MDGQTVAVLVSSIGTLVGAVVYMNKQLINEYSEKLDRIADKLSKLEKLDEIIEAMEGIGDEHRLRRWLAENVPGLGFKEASHFLRNVGFRNLAIIDFHIIRLLKRYGLLGDFRSLTRRRYLEIEKLLREIADRLGLSLAELDLYLWYLDSGKIVK